jgi:hypothetical protein
MGFPAFLIRVGKESVSLTLVLTEGGIKCNRMIQTLYACQKTMLLIMFHIDLQTSKCQTEYNGKAHSSA